MGVFELPFCRHCAKPIPVKKVSSGRPGIFCHKSCKQAFHRNKKSMEERVWRADVLVMMTGPDFIHTFEAIYNGEAHYQTKDGRLLKAGSIPENH